MNDNLGFEERLREREAVDNYATAKSQAASIVANADAVIANNSGLVAANAVRTQYNAWNDWVAARFDMNKLEPNELRDLRGLKVDLMDARQRLADYVAGLQ
jgi:hypothetical protein